MSRNRQLWVAAAALAGVGAGTFAGQRHLRRQIEADPENEALRTPPRGRALSITSSDGSTLHAESFGPEDGQTLVLVHGWTESLSYWTYVTSELSGRGYRVVSFDLRGHGDSGRARGGDYSLARFGEDLEAVLASAVSDREHAVVAGHSLGAMSIVAWAHDHDVSGRIGGAALLNTGVGDLIAEHLLFPLPKVAHALSESIALRGFLGSRAPLPRFSTPLSHGLIRYVAFGPDASPAQIAFYERMILTCPPDVRADVGLAMSEMDLREAVPRLTVPTLVMAGANDRLTPPVHAERIAERLPQLQQLIVLPDTGHMGPLERPREVTSALVALARTAASPRSDSAVAQLPHA